MNNKGQVILYSLMMATVVILFAIGVAPTLKIFTDEARQPTTDTHVGLDCGNTSISDFDKASCMAIDVNFPFMILSLIAIAGVIIGTKVLLSQ